MIRFTPWEAVVVAADIAVKSANVEIGFMDRFSGSLILTGGLTEVQTAVEEVVKFFREVLGFKTCAVHKVKTYEKSVILYRWCLCNCRNS